jgi:hypothetical protein
MGHGYRYASLNVVEWQRWSHLHELTAGAGSSELAQALRTITPPRVRDADEQEMLRKIAETFDALPTVLQPMYAAMAMRVDQPRFAPRLAELFAKADDSDRAYVRREIVQLSFLDGGHQMWGQHEIVEPLLLVAALVPAFRHEVVVRLWSDDSPPPGVELDDLPVTRALGLVLPRLPPPMWPVESRTLSPDEVAVLAPQLQATHAFDVSEDPKFFSLVADIRQVNDAAADLLADLELIARVFADCAARRLGLDIYYHANP